MAKEKIIYEKSTIEMLDMGKKYVEKEFDKLNKSELLILSKKLYLTCYLLNNDLINAIEHYNQTQDENKNFKETDLLKPFYEESKN